jgi:hypothetical protein
MAEGANPVTIRDVDVPFWRIVMILIKWSIAAIPAAIIVALVYGALAALLGGVFMAIFQLFGVPIPDPNIGQTQ